MISTTQFIEAAQELSRNGFHVFPLDHPKHAKCLAAHIKTPCSGKRGKHPVVNWKTFTATETPPQMIDTIWNDKGGGYCNIGIACGPSGLVVLDEDAPGEIDRWCEAYGIELPDTYIVTTGRGRHLYFTWDHSEQPITNREKVFAGFEINVRGAGGFAVGEGSLHETGSLYLGNGIPKAPLPTQVARMLLAAQAADGHTNGSVTLTEAEAFLGSGGTGDPNSTPIPAGSRHAALLSYAGRLRAKGMDLAEAEILFRKRWELCEQPEGNKKPWEVALAVLTDVYGRYEAGEENTTGVGAQHDPFEAEITERLNKLRIDREAKRRLEEETKPPVTLPPVRPLGELLSEADIETPYLVDKIAPAGGRVLLSAQYKAGKTHLALNLIRSLADGDPFLGRFEIRERKHNIVLIDDELSDNTIRRWLRQQNIRATEAVADVIALRGKVGTLNLIDDKTRHRWAVRLKDSGCDYLILDCLRPVLDSLGLDENRDAGKFLVAFDALLEEAGITDALLVQHMGHANERARGDSRLQDWPDAIWRLVRETDEPDSARYFSAYGRDVDVPEGRLSYDTGTGWLTYAAGSRKDAKTEGALPDVIDLLASDAQDGGEGISGRKIEEELESSEHTRNAIRSATKLAVTRRIVETVTGPKRAKLHRIANPCSLCFRPMLAGQVGQHNSCQQWDRDLW